MKKRQKKVKVSPWRWVVALVCAALIAGFFGIMLMNASLLHVMKTTVGLEDLPPAFEGVSILYISDIDLCGLNIPERAADAVMRLQATHPDILILGGDYTSPTLYEILNKSTDITRMLKNRSQFFQAITGFTAPMGKYALISGDDAALGDMVDTLNAAGFQNLNGIRHSIAIGDDVLYLTGIGFNSTTHASYYAREFHRDECVICVAESPDYFPSITVAETREGGSFADLCLAGKTHGGQILLFGRSALSLTGIEQQYRYGWTRSIGVPMLTTSGMGCEAANLRLGTQAEAWLIRLKCFT